MKRKKKLTKAQRRKIALRNLKKARRKVRRRPRNAWAICHARLGRKKTKKFERCVKSIKRKIRKFKKSLTRDEMSLIRRAKARKKASYKRSKRSKIFHYPGDVKTMWG